MQKKEEERAAEGGGSELQDVKLKMGFIIKN